MGLAENAARALFESLRHCSAVSEMWSVLAHANFYGVIQLCSSICLSPIKVFSISVPTVPESIELLGKKKRERAAVTAL